jgi:DNA gyrase subunit B
LQQGLTQLPQGWDPIALIRMRPGLWLGGADSWALHSLLYIIVDNSVDQSQLGRCSHCKVVLHPGNAVSVEDDGPGIPVSEYGDTGRSIAELIFTKAAGRFNAERQNFTLTLRGAGLPVVNALSTSVLVEIRRDGYLWQQSFEAGQPVTELRKIRALLPTESTGTAVTFRPDFTIFEQNDFQIEILSERFRDLSFLANHLAITLRDERNPAAPEELTFQAEDGLLSCIDYLRGNFLPVSRPIRGEYDIDLSLTYQRPGPYRIEFVCQYTTALANLEESLASRYKLLKGRPPMYGLRDAFVDFINRFARKSGGLVPGDPKFTYEEIRTGLIAVVNLPNIRPDQTSAARCELSIPLLRSAMYQVVMETLAKYAEQHPQDMRAIVDWLVSRRLS